MGSRVREGRKARGRSRDRERGRVRGRSRARERGRVRGRVEHRMEIGWEGDEKKDGREQMGEKE